VSKDLEADYNARLNKWVNLVTELEKEIQNLKADNHRLTNLLEAATIAIEANKNLVKQLKDRNERLREAGDTMDRFIRSSHCTVESKMVIADWRAAKGVQS